MAGFAVRVTIKPLLCQRKAGARDFFCLPLGADRGLKNSRSSQAKACATGTSGQRKAGARDFFAPSWVRIEG